MDLFENVKETVPIVNAAEVLGFHVHSGGYINCPLHTDHTPSLKLYPDHFYCYSCNTHGDVIDLARITLRCSPLEAVQYLADVFGISSGSAIPVDLQARFQNEKERRITDWNASKAKASITRKLLDILCFIKYWQKEHSPMDIATDIDALYAESLNLECSVTYLCDLMRSGEPADQELFMKNSKEKMEDINARLEQFK
jgi:hypothetical protein